MLVTLASVCMCKTQSEVYVICQLDSRRSASQSVSQSVNNNHSTGDLDSFMPHCYLAIDDLATDDLATDDLAIRVRQITCIGTGQCF